MLHVKRYILVLALLFCIMPLTVSANGKTGETNTGEALPDERTAALSEDYASFFANSASAYAEDTLSYEEELAKFPADYQALIKELHKKYPNWIFVAYDTGLTWDEVIAGESKGTTSLLRNYNDTLLLSKDAADYDASTGSYIIKDSSSSVNANDAAIAYFVDPRNYLTETNVFALEKLSYDATAHTLDAVEAILNGTDLYKKIITYVDTAGQSITLPITYGQAILTAGVEHNVSPVMLASRIRQETSGRLTNGSNSGTFEYNGVKYTGYYNFFNIKASGSGQTAIANGLIYAQGSGSYGRPWTSPVLSISGGAQFLASSYISIGQDTNYYQKFDIVTAPYYNHQYMQTLYAVMNESLSTYNSYTKDGSIGNTRVFSVPVYKNMPVQSPSVGRLKIAKTDSTGITTASDGVNMRKGPGTSYDKVGKIPYGSKVTVSGGIFMDAASSTTNKLSYPYWFKVTWNGQTGYISSSYLKMNTSKTIAVGTSSSLTLASYISGEKIYYQTQNPAIAVVNSHGVITGVSAGECMIYAYTSSGQAIDAIGITVTKSYSAHTPGWSLEDGTWYFYNSDGTMVYDWAKIGSHWYYFQSDGSMATGWILIRNCWYYLHSDGSMATGWTTIDGIRYYLRPNGIMAAGWIELDGIRYYLHSNGSMATGWIELDGVRYYLHSDGSMATGWIELDGVRYYLHSDGSMATGWVNLEGTWYYLLSDGSMAMGWINLGGIWYYLRSDGSMATGWVKLGGIWYYLRPDGSMATGWINLEGTWYYLLSDGSMATGWINPAGTYYYLSSSGAMVTDAWVDNGRYYVDSSGAWIPNK